MERKIIIVDSASNSQTPVITNATTFGELKAAVRAAGVNIEGKDWLEGLTKTQPMSDDALLPTNVNYKGQTTNNLVYMLTNTNKKTRSGAMSYTEMKSYIKANGLADIFQKKYGKSYTQGKTVEFTEFINQYQAEKNTANVDAVKPAVEQPKRDKEAVEPMSINYKENYEALVYGVACLLASLDEDIMSDVENTLTKINESMEAETLTDVDFSSSEISSMFKGLK